MTSQRLWQQAQALQGLKSCGVPALGSEQGGGGLEVSLQPELCFVLPLLEQNVLSGDTELKRAGHAHNPSSQEESGKFKAALG